MKEQTYFHIPTPCHEDWNNMTPEGKGRFCTSCSKQVVDFSLMSDQQVLNYFKNTTGGVCGRFANEQLQRPMIEVAEQKKKTWWFALMMPLLLLFDKTNAQTKGKVKAVKPVICTTKQPQAILGQVQNEIDAAPLIPKINYLVGDTLSKPTHLIISGVVSDMNEGSPLPFASVIIKGSDVGAIADSKGAFTLSFKRNTSLPVIQISYVGYQQKEIDLNHSADEIVASVSKSGDFEEIVLKPQSMSMQNTYLGDVVVVGGIFTSKKVKRVDSVKTTVNKIFKREQFKIFPNPVQSGNATKIELLKAGDYNIQLIDNNGKPIATKTINTKEDKTLTEINIPVDAAPGIYYIVVTDQKKKKQYTDKLIVQ